MNALNVLMDCGTYTDHSSPMRDRLMHELHDRDSHKHMNESKTSFLTTLCAVPIMKEATAIFFDSTSEVNWEKVAEDPTTSWQLLELLANHNSTKVRAAVADNANARPDTLLRLAHDTDPDLRYQLAENHNICREVLEILVDDENPYVRLRAETTKRRSTSKDLLLKDRLIDHLIDKREVVLFTT